MLMKIANKKIYYEVKGTGQPVVFCHGFGGNHVIWLEQVKYLVKHGYQTITFDQVGHGQSQGDAATGIKELIDDTAQLIKNLQLKNVILIGHSMGAAVIWGLLKYHPEINVRKIVTIDQTPKMLNDANWSYGFLNLTKDNFKNIFIQNKHVKETLNRLDDRVWAKLHPFKEKYPFNRQANLPLIFDHSQKDWRPLVYQISVPMLDVSSSKSPYFKLGYTTEMQKYNKAIEVKVVDDTGHDVMAEKPDEFNNFLGEFLKI